jgi:hypothetical protein
MNKVIDLTKAESFRSPTMPANKPLVIAGCCSILGALLHLVCIGGGADWYRLMGAGERIAKQVEAGEVMPAVITLLISSLLLVWALLAFSGAGLIRKLPMLRTGLVLISSVYLLRGIAGFFLPLAVFMPLAPIDYLRSSHETVSRRIVGVGVSAGVGKYPWHVLRH